MRVIACWAETFFKIANMKWQYEIAIIMMLLYTSYAKQLIAPAVCQLSWLSRGLIEVVVPLTDGAIYFIPAGNFIPRSGFSFIYDEFHYMSDYFGG